MCITSKSVHLKKKNRIILIGDSNIKGHVCILKPLLSNNYELYSVVKPRSTTMNKRKQQQKRSVNSPMMI